LTFNCTAGDSATFYCTATSSGISTEQPISHGQEKSDYLRVRQREPLRMFSLLNDASYSK